MFASSFAEGDSTISQATHAKSLQDYFPRRRIKLAEHGSVVSTVLNYIYTEKVSFSIYSDIALTEDYQCGQPNVCKVEAVYALAHLWGVDELANKALGFLKQTCNDENIGKRAFESLANLYEDVGEAYNSYLRAHWPAAVDKYCQEAEAEGDAEKLAMLCRRLRETLKPLALDSKVSS